MYLGYIYKIESEKLGKCYIGSSTIPLSQRKAVHSYDVRIGKNKRTKDIIESPDCKYSIIRDVVAVNRKDLIKQEGEEIRKHNNSVNCHMVLSAEDRRVMKNLTAKLKRLENKLKRTFRK